MEWSLSSRNCSRYRSAHRVADKAGVEGRVHAEDVAACANGCGVGGVNSTAVHLRCMGHEVW